MTYAIRAMATALLLLAASAQSAETSSPPAKIIGGSGWDTSVGSPSRVFAEQNRLLLATDSGALLVYDITNRSDPRFLFRYTFLESITGATAVSPDGIYAVFRGVLNALQFNESGTLTYLKQLSINSPNVTHAGNYVYVPSSQGLWVFNHIKVQELNYTGEFRLGVSLATAPVVEGNRAYAALAGRAAVQILDVSNLAFPQALAVFNVSQQPLGIAVHNNVLAAVEGSSRVNFYDVSNPNAVVPLIWPGTATHITPAFAGNRVVVAENTIRIFDVSDPSRITLAGTIPIMAQSVAARENHAYVADLHALRIFDVSGAAPTLVRKIVTPGQAGDDVQAFAVSGGRAFAINRFSGLNIFDVRNVSLPRPLTNFVADPDIIAGAVSASNALLFSSNSLTVVDLVNPATPHPIAEIPASLAFDAAVANSHVFAAGRKPGLSVYDLTTPANPSLSATLFPTNEFRRVEVFGTNLFLFDDRSVRRVDITDPTAPRDLGLSISAAASDIHLANDLMFVPLSNRVAIFDVSSMATPSEVGAIRRSGATAVSVRDDFAFVAWRSSMEIYDVSNPTSPELWGAITTTRPVKEILHDGGLIYVVLDNGSFQIMERNPRVVRVQAPDQPRFTMGETVRITWRTQGDPSDQFELRITCTNNNPATALTMPIPVVRDAVDQWNADWIAGEPFDDCGAARFTVTELYSRTSIEAFGAKGVLLEKAPAIALQRGVTNRIVLPAGHAHYSLEAGPKLTGPWLTITNAARPTLYQPAYYPILGSTNAEARFYRLKRD
ncbi:MAG TPA: hypothetical protein VM680_19965 [Verrucomicrobiae bacterium]|nr:hypothetical protein [Verrucomicrobiae bacterium]